MEEGLGLMCSSSSSSSKCGRWNPTLQQVKVLTELFSAGLRTPSTEQIQKISRHLSSFGKIESKNVFYWFQNHKARERLHQYNANDLIKKRRRQQLHHPPHDHHHHHHQPILNLFLNLDVNRSVNYRKRPQTQFPPPGDGWSTRSEDEEKITMFKRREESQREKKTLELFPLTNKLPVEAGRLGMIISSNTHFHDHACLRNVINYEVVGDHDHQPSDQIGFWEKINDAASALPLDLNL